MKKVLDNKSFLMALASGVLSFIATLHMVFPLAWFSYVLFFLSLKAKTIRQSLILGFIFGLGVSIPAFYWMIPAVEKYTGLSEVYGLAAFLLATIVFSSYWGALGASFNFLKIRLRSSFLSSLVNALSVAVIITLGEFALNVIFSGMPWFNYNTGTGFLKNIYAVQLATFFGLPGISFLVVFVNFLISEFINNRRWLSLILSVFVIPVCLFWGYLILSSYNTSVASNPIRIALVSENFPPEIKWDSNSGEELVNTLFGLEKEAVQLKPQLMLWSESTIPWTYKPDDDFVNEVLRISSPVAVNHIIGINTDYSKSQVYNSVYSLMPDGKIAGRYDKRFLLDFIEKPVCNLLIQFLSSDGASVKAGSHDEPLQTAFGKAGIIICNEAVLENPAEEMVRNGAQYFLTLSNDGWFRDSYIVGLHFYTLRLRAVECRKDIAINCNNGISGMIDASGRVLTKLQSKTPLVTLVNVYPNNYKSCTGSSQKVFLYSCVLLLLTTVIIRILRFWLI